MWPWKRQAIEDRVKTAEGRLSDAESTLRLLKGEWLDTLDRLERMVGRVVKRGQRDSLLSTPAGNGEAPGEVRSVPPPGASRAMVEVLKRRTGTGKLPGA